jgi:ATP-dependent DNA ligase
MSLPEFYSPMAAKGGDLEAAAPYWDDPNYVAQEKLDGARYILHKNEQGIVTVYSRRISVKTGKPVDKTLQLNHLAEEFDRIAPNGTVIDGEVVAPGKSAFNLVTRVTGSTAERAFELQRDSVYLEYAAFDILALDGKPVILKSYNDREDMLTRLLQSQDSIRFIKQLPISNSGKRTLYDKVIANGGEGVILKDLREPYRPGERHKAWIKVKRQKTFDVVFMGIEDAKEMSVKKGDTEATKSRIAGMAGAIRYGQFKPFHFDAKNTMLDLGLVKVDGRNELVELGTVSGFDDAVRADITANAKKYIGRVFEVAAQAQFPKSGALQNPRFLQWRDDKRAVDCVFRPDEG